jgi:hypothetical protein
MTSTKLEPHPLSAIFPPISDEDFGKLAADINLNGLHQAIVRYQGKILDGNNRYRACELVKIAPKFADFNGDDAQARNYVISANIHRRHLSPDQRREIIATLLKADPTKSDRQIVEWAGNGIASQRAKEAISQIELSSVLIAQARQVQHITTMNDDMLLPSELDVAGTCFDADYYWRWIEAQRTGCWFWSDWETALMYLDSEWES